MLNKLLSLVLCFSISLFSFLSWDIWKTSRNEVLQNRHVLSFIDKNQNDLAKILATLSDVTLQLSDKQTAHNGLLNAMAQRQQERTVLVSDIPLLRREVVINTEDIEKIKKVLLEIVANIHEKNKEKEE